MSAAGAFERGVAALRQYKTRTGSLTVPRAHLEVVGEGEDEVPVNRNDGKTVGKACKKLGGARQTRGVHTIPSVVPKDGPLLPMRPREVAGLPARSLLEGVHLLAAMTGTGLVTAQREVDGKTNESSLTQKRISHEPPAQVPCDAPRQSLLQARATVTIQA